MPLKRPALAHRAEFSVRCACGMVYNTSDQHIGKKLKCRCGQIISIVRPPSELSDAHKAQSRGRSKRGSTSGRWRSTNSSARWTTWMSSRLRSTLRTVRPVWRVVVESWSAMNSRRPIRRWTARISWAWLIAIVTTWLLLITTSESFLPATLLAYGPRFLLLLPFLPLLMVSAIAARKSLLPLSLAMLIVLGPIMGGRVSWRTIGRGIPPTVAPGMLRILTYNTEGGRLVASRLREVIRDLKPDILAFQECGDILWDSVRVLAEYHTARYANLCTGSRWPITSSDTMPRADFARIATYGYGGTGLVHRLILASPYGPLVFVNLHLETARRGLEALIGDDGLVPDRIDRRRSKPPDQRGSAMERIRLNAEIRDRESERASVWSSRGDKSIPLVVTGDFNLPVESTIFRRHWEGFTDSFESAGSGFGWSRREGRLLRIRIDHVLTNGSALQPIGSWIGPDFGSDHLPVIADLFWRHR